MYGRSKGRKRKGSAKPFRKHSAKRGRYTYNAPFGGSGNYSGKTGRAITRSIGGAGSIMPDRFKTVLKWTQVIQAANTPAFRYVVRGNSAHDPGFTSGTSQPNGFNALAQVYSYYRVHWSKIKISYNITGPTATVPFILTVYPSITSNPFTAALQTFASTRYSSSQVMANGSVGGVSAYGAGGTSNAITNAMSTRKIFGDVQDSESVYGAAASADPAAPWFWVIDGLTLDGSSFQTTAYFFIEVMFGMDMESPLTTQI